MDRDPITSAERADAVDDAAVSKGRVFDSLSDRELEIVRLMCEGATNSAIAFRAGITVNTVKWHVSQILGKLGMSSRTQAIVAAFHLGLIEAGSGTINKVGAKAPQVQ